MDKRISTECSPQMRQVDTRARLHDWELEAGPLKEGGTTAATKMFEIECDDAI
jgi:hypothetical protein